MAGVGSPPAATRGGREKGWGGAASRGEGKCGKGGRMAAPLVFRAGIAAAGARACEGCGGGGSAGEWRQRLALGSVSAVCSCGRCG